MNRVFLHISFVCHSCRMLSTHGRQCMALHPNLMRKGLAMNSAKAVKHELFEEMDMAANSSFAYKMHLAQRFNKELLPKILEATNESLTYHAQQRGEDTVYNKRMMARDTARQAMQQRARPL